MENSDPSLTPVDLPSAPPSPSPQMEPSPSSNKNLITGAAALVALLALGAAAAYFYYPPSPEKVAARIAKVLAQTNSVEFGLKMDMEINTTLEGLPQGTEASRQIKMNMEFDGASDSSDVNNPKFYGMLKVTGEGLVMSADVRGIGKVFYLKLNEAPLLGFIDPGKIKNQWLKIDTEELNKELGLENQGYNELTEEQKKLILALYENSKIIKLEKRVNSETVNDVKTHHYQFTIDRQEFKMFMLRVMEITNKELTAEDKAEFEKILDQIQFEAGEIWVGRKDSLPYKVSMVINVQGDAENPGNGKVAFTANFKNYNQPVSVEAPSNSKSFKELFSETFGSMNQDQELPNIPVPTN